MKKIKIWNDFHGITGSNKSGKGSIKNGKMWVMTFIDDPFLKQKEGKFYQKTFS